MALPPKDPKQQSQQPQNPLGVSESASDEAQVNKTGKPNPLKAWAIKKLIGAVTR